MANLDWIIVETDGGKKIGAVGLLGRKAAAVVSFHEEHRQGALPGELVPAVLVAKFGHGSRPVIGVARAASRVPRIANADATLPKGNFAIYDGYSVDRANEKSLKAAFNKGLSKVPGTSGLASTKIVQRFLLRRGMEKQVQSALIGLL